MDRDRLLETLVRDEGLKLMPYTDTVCVLTIGIGTNLESVGWKGETYNSEDAFLSDYPDGITEEEAYEAAEAELDEILGRVEELCEAKGVVWDDLSDLRQEVIVNLCYNLGLAGINGFRKMWGYLADRNYVQAGIEGLDSRWATQVKRRSHRLMFALATNDETALELSDNRR